jgi:hypothetical protein
MSTYSKDKGLGILKTKAIALATANEYDQKQFP